jgi:hypothetical protein
VDLRRVECELKKRYDFGYNWKTKQNDLYDGITQFIYKINRFDDLIKKVEYETSRFSKDYGNQFDRNIFYNYVLNRWYNFWSARAVEFIFCSHQLVKTNKNPRDRYVDFSINGIDFDHKTSIFPRGFKHDLSYAMANKRELIEWLYLNQSQQRRKHMMNRLFLIVYDSKNYLHWKVKAELELLKEIIFRYLDSFAVSKLEVFTFEAGRVTYSDIIWAVGKIL